MNYEVWTLPGGGDIYDTAESMGVFSASSEQAAIDQAKRIQGPHYPDLLANAEWVAAPTDEKADFEEAA